MEFWQFNKGFKVAFRLMTFNILRVIWIRPLRGTCLMEEICHGWCFYISDLVTQFHTDFDYRTRKHETIRQLSLQGHRVVDTDEKRLKPCVVCASRNVRSHRGHSIRIRHQCAKCGVALCIGYRECFTLHHQSLLSWLFASFRIYCSHKTLHGTEDMYCITSSLDSFFILFLSHKRPDCESYYLYFQTLPCICMMTRVDVYTGV